MRKSRHRKSNNKANAKNSSKIDTIAQPEVDNFFKDAVNSTYDYLLDTVKLASTKKELLLMQSVQGRAVNGWWEPEERFVRNYETYCYPNTTLEDVFDALGYDVDAIQAERQKINSDISKYVDNLFIAIKNSRSGVTNNKKNIMGLVNDENEVLAGIKHFEGAIIKDAKSAVDVLRGVYLGGCMDCADWRAKTDERYGIKMHKGVCRAVNIDKLKQEGLTMNDLTNLEVYDGIYNLSLDRLINKGIVSNKSQEKYGNGFVNGFVELDRGFGISDDAAFIFAGLLFNIETAYGLMLMDAVDTWDKSTPTIIKNGLDEKIGLGVKTRYEAMFGKGSFPCDDEDTMRLIFLASNFPLSCSQRRFVEYDKSTKLYPIKSHVAFIDAVKNKTAYPPSFKMAFEQVESLNFYKNLMCKYLKYNSTF